MFTRSELKILAMTVGLFLAGLGWKVVQANIPVPPLQMSGAPVVWSPLESVAEPTQPAAIKQGSSKSAKKAGKEEHLVLNPNNASLAQLQKLPGIGPALALRIAEARKLESFQSLQDLDRVKGIGPAKLAKLAPHFTF